MIETIKEAEEQAKAKKLEAEAMIAQALKDSKINAQAKADENILLARAKADGIREKGFKKIDNEIVEYLNSCIAQDEKLSELSASNKDEAVRIILEFALKN